MEKKISEDVRRNLMNCYLSILTLREFDLKNLKM
jgi:hypothetical protein